MNLKVLFENDMESFLFAYYHQETADELSGTLETSIWNRLLLQTSEEQAFLRHGLIVIGALNWSMKRGKPKIGNDHNHSSAPSLGNDWTKDAWLLHYYDMFLVASRKALSKTTYSKRLALMVCLVIICIERLQWRLSAAASHIRSGIQLLEAIKDEENAVEDEIVQQFQSLDIEASIFQGFNIKNGHNEIEHEPGREEFSMPYSFNTVSEARSSLQKAIQQTRRFILKSRNDDRVSTSPSYGLETTPNCDFELLSDIVAPLGDDIAALTSRWRNLQSAQNIERSEKDHLVSKLQRWSTAFRPLLQTIPEASDDFLNACALVAQSHAITINLTGSLSPSEGIYDSFHTEFADIVTQARLFLTHPRSSKVLKEGSFSLTSRMIYPLQVVADKCRDRILRREAIALLKSAPWREGSWSSLASATIAEWLMTVEEEGVETDYIPVEARLRIVDSGFYEEQVPRPFRKGRLRCFRGEGETLEWKIAAWEWTFDAPNVYRSSIGKRVEP